jgi:hypothetical protein
VSELPQNFTFAVMAEVNSMPAPRARAHPVWSFIVLYSVAAWVAGVAAMLITHTPLHTVVAAITGGLAHMSVFWGAVGAGVSQSVGHMAPPLAAFGAGVLAIDVAFAGAFALLYFVLRPRVVARLASVPESE